MTGNRANSQAKKPAMPTQTALANSYYALLGLHPSASPIEIRRAYRELSKRYHPDTTDLPQAKATQKFQQLNEAYATLSNPEKRLAYDRKIRYSNIPVVQPRPGIARSPIHAQNQTYSSSAYLDATDRPLSAGEIFALFILGVTFITCIVLAIAVALIRGETSFQPLEVQTQTSPLPSQINQNFTPVSKVQILENNLKLNIANLSTIAIAPHI